MCLVNWYLRINIFNSQISVYIDEKKKKGNGFLSKKFNFVEYEDIVYHIDMILTGKNIISVQIKLTMKKLKYMSTFNMY